MNYVFLIGESIGWQELILIGVLALVVFGPRKLPELLRKAGKLMAELRQATNEFKSTWENEVSAISDDVKSEVDDLNNDVKMLSHLENPKPVENSIGRNQGWEEQDNGNSANGNSNGNTLELPSVKQVEPEQLQQLQAGGNLEAAQEVQVEKAAETKKDWL